MKKIILVSLFVGIKLYAVDFETHLQNEERISIGKIFGNISRSDTEVGAVVASPSKHDPDYYYHWIRDSALTMDVVVLLYTRAQNPTEKQFYFNALTSYINFERKLQFLPVQGGLGEPKFRVDGTAYNEPWGRPQNDSPALRALTLSKLAFVLIREGQIDFVNKYLYSDGFSSMIKMDLEYTAKNWQNPCFDLWEEVSGHHFYTRIVQRKALILGAKLAVAMNDPHAASYYLETSRLIERALMDHWNPQYNFLMTTFGDGGYKTSNLDTAALLGAIHANSFDDFLSPSDDKVLATLVKIVDTFKKTYSLNSKAGIPGVAIGRYPEDRYYGGNPWFLTTHAVAETLYLAISNLKRIQQIRINPTNIVFYKYFLGFQDIAEGQIFSEGDARFNEILSRMFYVGDLFMKRSWFHQARNGSQSEQFNRENGYMLSAVDLTWSYASFLTAKWARDMSFLALPQ